MGKIMSVNRLANAPPLVTKPYLLSAPHAKFATNSKILNFFEGFEGFGTWKG